MVAARSQEIDDLVATISRSIEEKLVLAEQFVDSKYRKVADDTLYLAVSAINQLQYQRRHRRGNPREQLLVRIRFYGIWHRALLGRLKITEQGPWGDTLLRNSYAEAIQLYAKHPDSSEFKELLDKVKGWQRQ